MASRQVYLAGPITSKTYAEAQGWRDEAARWLTQFGITTLSPMRGKDYLAKVGVIADAYDAEASWPLSHSPGFTFRDRWDVEQADVVLVNLIGAERVSIGSVMECAWADAFRKPLVLAVEPGSVHDHAMLKQVAPYVVDTLGKALALLPPILNATPRVEHMLPFEE